MGGARGPTEVRRVPLAVIPILGTIVPYMGTNDQPTSIADALFPKVRQRVLAALFGQPDRRFYTKELIRLADSGVGAVHRELEALAGSRLVTVSREGNHKYYQANADSPIFAELRDLVVKSFGVADQLRAALAALSHKIRLAVFYGSVAKGTAHSGSDVDLLIVSDELLLEEVFAALEEAEQRLGRPVNPTLYSTAEYRRRLQSSDSFLGRVLEGDHLVLVGNADAIR